MKAKLISCAALSEAFARASMVYPSGVIEPGKLSRFSTNNNPLDKSGWCKYFLDGMGAAFGCNRAGTSFVWQLRDSSSPMPTRAERQAFRVQAEQERQYGERQRAAEQLNAAESATLILAKTTPADPAHAYIARKGITPYGARHQHDGALVLPVYGPAGALQTLQFIRPDGEKRFLSHGKVKGGRLLIGKPVDGQPLTLTEGWATACSVHDASGEVVVVAFSGSNMAAVATDLRRQYPASQLRICGDLDAHGKGLEYAQAAAASGTPASVLLPAFADGRVRGDFNDLAQAEGLDAVRAQLAAVPIAVDRAVMPFIQPLLVTCDARDGTCNSRPMTELGNAQRLYDANGEHVRYVHDAQSWLLWHDGAWHWDIDGAGVRSLAARLPASIYAEGSGHLVDAEHFGRWARKSQEQRIIVAAVALLSDSPHVRLPLAYVDADPYVVAFDRARQVIDLRNGSMRAAVPSDFITKSLGAADIGNVAGAVRWTQFLDQVFGGDQELIRWLQCFCGYMLSGSTQEQIFLFCHGHGANGKSVFIELLKHVLGDYARAVASETLAEAKRPAGGATPDLAELIGARLVMCNETEDNTAMAESLVKSLVSGDSMAVRQLYKAPVQFAPVFKLIICGNHRPVVRGTDNGLWRRIRLVPFGRTFALEERDPNLLSKLKAETPHILAWMVAGSVTWVNQGLPETPKLINAATDEYRVDQDIVGRWLEERTSVSPYGEESTGDLYTSYSEWCMKNGLRAVSTIVLGRRLGERGYALRKSHGNRFWRGLTLKSGNCTTPVAYLRATEGH